MKQLEFDQQRISGLLDQLGTLLTGEWLLVGGALVSVWVEPRRVTQDIDLIGLQGHANERFALMDAVLTLGLPIEAVNSAADYFVQRIAGWRGEIEVLRQHAHCVFYRPTPTLFVMLKIGRLSEQDLQDCLAVIRKARAEQLPVDTPRLLAALDEFDESRGPEALDRVAQLRQVLQGSYDPST
jgi:hypothetical protein